MLLHCLGSPHLQYLHLGCQLLLQAKQHQHLGCLQHLVQHQRLLRASSQQPQGSQAQALAALGLEHLLLQPLVLLQVHTSARIPHIRVLQPAMHVHEMPTLTVRFHYQWHLWAYYHAHFSQMAIAGAASGTSGSASGTPSFGLSGPASSSAPALSTFQFPSAPSSAPASTSTAGSTLGASLFPQAVSTPLPPTTASTSTPLSFGIETAAASSTPAANPASSAAATAAVSPVQGFNFGSTAAPSAPPPGDVCKLLTLLLLVNPGVCT